MMRLLFAGDFLQAKPTKLILGDQLKSLITDSDYCIANIEGPIGFFERNESVNKSGPYLCQPNSVALLLKEAGFNVLALANNHLFDFGIKGYEHTKSILNDFKLIGCGTWDEAYNLTILEKEGIKVGLLNFAEMQFGMLYDEWSQPNSTLGCGWINHHSVNKLIIDSKKKVDFLIIIIHAGLEMIDIPLPEWRNRYREMIDLGCDAVVGGHPHVPQGYEIYRNRPIFYSLGNFYFSSLDGFNSDSWNIGEVVSLTIGKSGLDFSLHAVRNSNSRLEMIAESEWNPIILNLNKKLDDDFYIQLVNEICTERMKDYWKLFNMGGLIHPDKDLPKSIARHFLKKYNHIHLLNLLRCESHRWCISRALQLEDQ